MNSEHRAINVLASFHDGVSLPPSRRGGVTSLSSRWRAVFSLAMRMAISFSLIVSGWCLSGIGYQVPRNGRAVTQTPQAV